jgi:hypothetical protein
MSFAFLCSFLAFSVTLIFATHLMSSSSVLISRLLKILSVKNLELIQDPSGFIRFVYVNASFSALLDPVVLLFGSGISNLCNVTNLDGINIPSQFANLSEIVSLLSDDCVRYNFSLPLTLLIFLGFPLFALLLLSIINTALLLEFMIVLLASLQTDSIHFYVFPFYLFLLAKQRSCHVNASQNEPSLSY